MHGVTSYLPIRRPTIKELQECKLFEITSAEPTWNPHSKAFSQRENNTMHNWKVLPQKMTAHQVLTMKTLPCDLSDAVDVHCSIKATKTINTSQCQSILCERLAKAWNIGETKAQQTIRATNSMASVMLTTHLLKDDTPQGTVIFVIDV